VAFIEALLMKTLILNGSPKRNGDTAALILAARLLNQLFKIKGE
jgi:hypothetical protein